MNYEKFKNGLGSWGPSLKRFITSPECDKIYKHIKDRSRAGADITPMSALTFNAFRECPMEDLKCIIIGMDPYPWVKDGIKVADGVAFSCSNTLEIQPSLRILYEGIEDDLYNGMNINMIKNPDLSYLSNQGVLLLNKSLTTEVNQVGAHKNLWNEFHRYLGFSVINIGTPIVFMGKEAENLRPLYKSMKHITCEHPAAAAWRKGAWNHNNVFSKINDLTGHNIKWAQEHPEYILEEEKS